MLIEGPRLLAEALDASVVLRDVFIDRPLSVTLTAMLDRAGVEVTEVLPGLLDRVGDVVASQGVVAVADLPAPGTLSSLTGGLALVLVDIADPGNVGAMLRTADAVAAIGVALVGHTVDWTNPKVVRASAGAVFRVPIVVEASPAAALATLSAQGVRCIGAVVHGGRPHYQVDLTGSVAIVVGNETQGLSEELCGVVDELMHLQMPGRAESLNVAMAATVLAFESVRQRGPAHNTLAIEADAGQA